MDALGGPRVSSNLDPNVVADWFVWKDAQRTTPDVTSMKLNKLLYLAQANWMASTNERLFDGPIEAYQHGPVVTAVWARFQGKQVCAERGSAPTEPPSLPDDVAEFLEAVWAKFQTLSAAALRTMTHDHTPWKAHYSPRSYRPVIPDEEIAAFFREQIPASERVFHSDAIVVSQAFLDDFDEEEAELRLRAFIEA